MNSTPVWFGTGHRCTPATKSELHIDINFSTIATWRPPQGTISRIAVGSMGAGTGNSPTTCSGRDTDPQLTVDTTRSAVVGTFLRIAVS